MLGPALATRHIHFPGNNTSHSVHSCPMHSPCTKPIEHHWRSIKLAFSLHSMATHTADASLTCGSTHIFYALFYHQLWIDIYVRCQCAHVFIPFSLFPSLLMSPSLFLSNKIIIERTLHFITIYCSLNGSQGKKRAASECESAWTNERKEKKCFHTRSLSSA